MRKNPYFIYQYQVRPKFNFDQNYQLINSVDLDENWSCWCVAKIPTTHQTPFFFYLE